MYLQLVSIGQSHTDNVHVEMPEVIKKLGGRGGGGRGREALVTYHKILIRRDDGLKVETTADIPGVEIAIKCLSLPTPPNPWPNETMMMYVHTVETG